MSLTNKVYLILKKNNHRKCQFADKFVSSFQFLRPLHTVFSWKFRNKLTNWTARCVAVSGDCDSFNIVIICCKPSGCGSHVIFFLCVFFSVNWFVRKYDQISVKSITNDLIFRCCGYFVWKTAWSTTNILDWKQLYKRPYEKKGKWLTMSMFFFRTLTSPRDGQLIPN